MRILYTICFCILSFLGMSQTATVLDKTTQQNLPGVTVYSNNPKISTQTNGKAQFDATPFKKSDTIFFKIMGYYLSYCSYNELKSMNFKVQLEENPISLSEVVISSNKWEEKKIETPNRIEKINMQEVALQNPQTTADLLGTSGYVFIQKSQLAGGSPMLRGMATNRVLFVVDGVRMNTAIFRAGNLQNVISIDVNELESTEILFGPGSVMYGSDAIGGVMDFQTLTPRFADTTDKKVFTSGTALMRFSTANSERTGHLDFNIGLKKLSFLTSFTYANYGDLRSGSVGGVNYFYRPSYVQTWGNKDYMIPNNDSTLQIGSKYGQINFMQKIRYKPNAYWDIDYDFHLSQTSVYSRYDRLYVVQTSGPYKNKLRWAEWYYGPQKWNMHRLGISNSKKTVIYDNVKFISAWQFFEESRYDREFMYRELRMQKENVNAISANLDFDKKIGSKLDLFYGVEALYNLVGSVASLTNVVTKAVDSTVTRYPNGSTWESYGVYAIAKYKLAKKLIVTGGARYSYYRIKADFDTTFFPFPFTNTKMSNGALNGSLGFVYSPFNSWQIYTNGSSGYRAPNIDDMGKVFESTPGYLVVPNPDLRPEYGYNVDLGTVKTFGSFLKIDVTGYYTFLKDAMVRKDFEFNGKTTIRYMGNSSKIQAVQNVTKIQVYGIQAGIDFFYKGFGLRSTISYQKGKEQTADSLIYYPLRHAAPLFGSTHLTYERKKLKMDFYANYNGKMDYKDLALTERVNTSYARDANGLAYVASWYTLNFKVAYYINQYVVLDVGIENILDLMYRPYSSGINAPGRNLIASLRAKF